MCEQSGMATPPRTMELAEAAGISKSYASEILSGRTPGRSLAIHIFRKTGWRHSSLMDLTAEQIDLLEEVDPWSPTKAAA